MGRPEPTAPGGIRTSFSMVAASEPRLAGGPVIPLLIPLRRLLRLQQLLLLLHGRPGLATQILQAGRLGTAALLQMQPSVNFVRTCDRTSQTLKFLD